MKNKQAGLAAVMGVIVSLTGCAATMGTPDPYYDYSQQAIIAPGFPVERIEQPKGYQLAGIDDLSRRDGYSSAWESGSAVVRDFGVGWHSREGNTSVVSALVRSVDINSYMKPIPGSDGYQFINGKKAVYLYQSGRYAEIAGDADGLIPDNAPDCAYGTGVFITSPSARQRFIGSYSEGIACNALGSITAMDFESQRQRAFRALGLL